MDADPFPPTMVQEESLLPTQVLLSPHAQALDFQQPPPPPAHADSAEQLRVLTASVQSIAGTVGQLGAHMQSVQAELTAMNYADDLSDHEADEDLEDGEVSVSVAPKTPEVKGNGKGKLHHPY